MIVSNSKNDLYLFVSSAEFGLFQYPKLFYLVNVASTTFAFLFLVQILKKFAIFISYGSTTVLSMQFNMHRSRLNAFIPYLFLV